MDLSGFRIGNYANVCDNDEILIGVNKGGVYFGRHGYCANIADFIKPILLTEEWLLKFGFGGILETGYRKDIIELNYITTDENFEFEFTIPMIPKWFLVQVKYVHQLQNLYFALTGQELEITKA